MPAYHPSRLQLPVNCCSMGRGLSAEALLGGDSASDLASDDELMLDPGSEAGSGLRRGAVVKPSVWHQVASWQLHRAADGTRHCKPDSVAHHRLRCSNGIEGACKQADKMT